MLMRGGGDPSYAKYAQRRAIKFVKKLQEGNMKIIRRNLLYLAGIAAQISDACNRLLTLTRGIGAHARMCGSSTFHQMSA